MCRPKHQFGVGRTVSVNYEAFIENVESRSDLDSRKEAVTAADATLQTLSQRISRGEATNLAKRLPDELADSVTTDETESAEEFSADVFVERVQTYEQEHTTLDAAHADRHVQAVLESLSEAINRNEWRSVRSQLPSDYGSLYETN